MTPTQPNSPSPAFQYVTLKPNGKQPAGGPGWQNRIVTGPVPARSADHNIGILGGSPVYPGHRLLVLDVDVKKGKRGQESLIAMQKELGPLPPTVTAITPTGGQHIYLAVPKDVPLDHAFGLLNRIGYPDIDLIGPGRFVVAPPSSIDGNAYAWTYSPDEVPVARAPSWLLVALRASGSASTPPRPSQSNEKPGKRLPEPLALPRTSPSATSTPLVRFRCPAE